MRWRVATRYPLVTLVIKRLSLAVGALFLVSVAVFAGTVADGGGDAALARLGPSASPAARQALRHTLGLDRPWPTRYWEWLDGALHGDLGQSYVSESPVAGLIAHQGVNTLILAGLAALVLIPVATGLGLGAGMRPGSVTDQVVLAGSSLLAATPQFVIGTVLVLVIAVQLRWLPVVSSFSGNPLARPLVLVLPVATLVVTSLGQVTRLVRAGVVQAVTGDAVEAARLNGIGGGRLLWRWILPGGVRPAVPAFATTVAYLLGGALIVETIFGYPGLASVLVQAANDGDVPVVQGIALIAAAVTIGLNLLADLVGLAVDPARRAALGVRA